MNVSTYYYCRVSTTEQTTDNQVQAIQAMHKAADKVFSDHGVSGTKPALERPAFAEMVSILKPNDQVIVTAIDRLGRGAVDTITTVETLIAMGVSVVSMREGVDFSTPTGKLVLTVLSAVAELERNNISERIKHGLQGAKERGSVLGGRITETGKQALAMVQSGASMKDVMEATGISRAQYYRYKAM